MSARSPWFEIYETTQDDHEFAQRTMTNQHRCRCVDSDELAFVLAIPQVPEPFFAKYIRAEQRRARRDETDAHITELSFAQEAEAWFGKRGSNDCAV